MRCVTGPGELREYIANHGSVVDFQPFAARNFESAGIEPQLMEDCRVNVGHIMPVFNRMEANFVGGSVDDAPFDPSARHPYRESINMMIATIAALGTRRPAEFGREKNQGLVEKPSAFEVLQQRGDRLVDFQAVRTVVFLEPAVRIPSARPTGTVLNLNEPRPAFDEAPSRE